MRILLRDVVHFLAVGALQLALDSALYIGLTRLGTALVLANVGGRLAGATLGFWLNGRLTFLHRTQPQLPVRFARYAVLWLTLTAISTVALGAIAHSAGLASSWWAKPGIEAVLGLSSFLASRHWVYQR